MTSFEKSSLNNPIILLKLNDITIIIMTLLQLKLNLKIQFFLKADICQDTSYQFPLNLKH